MKKDINLINLVEVVGTLEEQHEVEMSKNLTTISGIQRLANKISKEVKTAPGSNYYDASFGSPLYYLLKVISPREEMRVRQEFPIYLKFLMERIKDEQSQDETLQPSEKLLDLTLESLILNSEQGI